MRSDEDLMQAYVSGDERAFDALYARYHSVLTGAMRRHIASTHDVEDLVQLTFLKLHRAKHSYRIGTPLRPWLFMIARNARKDHLRASGRRMERPGEIDTAAVTDDPSKKLERAEDVSALYAALLQLSATLRRTVELHWLHDLAFEDVARVEGVLQGTARVRAHRACAQLRAVILNVA